MNERSIFAAAMDIADPVERAAYLERACGQDAHLRRHLEGLLAEQDELGSFLAEPLASAALAPGYGALSEGVGTRIGPYKLLQQIGEGGMGVVYMAEQEVPVRRKVALKIIKPGMDSSQVIARFEAERQALALMDHTNIARVFDAGTTASDRPYFVMELVHGVPMTQYCDENQLTPRERLGLFISVCHAIQHAHQKGIIHRDIKPSNIMVTLQDDQPAPTVIDFGVVKAVDQRLTERTLFTQYGALVGTLEYMSPEQAEFQAADVDTRADIYSLGVLLYELLTGTTPLTRERLKQTVLTEVLRLIREEEPPKPSTRLSETGQSLASVSAQRRLEPASLQKEVRGDLDWIVMKALEKNRSRRYATANELARDIERYLNDEPVEASPPTRWYRLRKLARKHRGLIGTGAAFIVLLIAGAGVSMWQAVRARNAEHQAMTARDNEAEQLRQAKRSKAQAEAVLKFFQDKVLSAPRPKGQEGGVSRDATIREALDQAEPEISRAFAGEPLVEASIRNTLGVSYWYLGAQDRALIQQERALALRRQELGPTHPDTVGIMNDVAIILVNQGKYREAQKLLEEVLEVKRRTLGPENPITLRTANNLANVMASQGQFEDAVKLAEDTLKIRRRVDGPETIFTLRSTYNAAIMRRYLGQLDGARASLEEALHTLRRVFGPDHQDTLRVMVALGDLLLEQGHTVEARRLFEQALEAQRRVLGSTADETLGTMVNLVETSRVEGRLDDAYKSAVEAAELHRQFLGPKHPQTLQAFSGLATVQRDQGRLAEARPKFEQAIGGLRRALSAGAPEVQRALNAYAWMLVTAEDPGVRDPRRALELANEVVDNAPRIREIWTTLGTALYRIGEWRQAIAAIETSEAVAPGRFTSTNFLILTMAHWQLGETKKAREAYEKAVGAMEQSSQSLAGVLQSLRRETTHLLGLTDSNPTAKRGRK